MTEAAGQIGTEALGYDPAVLRPGALHLGIGAFHRGHQQVYYDDLARDGERDWGVVGINLLPPDLGDAHRRQAGRYGVLARDQHGSDCRAIGTLREFHFVAGAADAARFADARFVTLTITEKGYCHVPGTTDLDPTSAIAADLAAPKTPATAVGFLCHLLEARRQAGGGGVTIASCDNVPANGRLLRAVMEQYAAEAWPQLGPWMRDNVAFPNSMVDRIVPAMSAESRHLLEATLGTGDALGVVTEPFRQWVLEDAVAGARPPFERAGVQIVPDVAPYEHMKHRMLNGLQSAYAELGRLCGCATSHAAATDPALVAWAKWFHKVQATTLACPPGEDLAAYGRVSLERLANPTIHHPLGQIATDGSFKLSQRIAAPAADLVAAGGDPTCHAMVLAAWMLQAGECKPDAGGFTPSDPLATRLADLRSRHAGDAAATAGAFLDLPIFLPALGKSAGFRELVAKWIGIFGDRTGRPEAIRAAIAGAVEEMADA
ncbi:fructuronate reductase [Rhodobium orientis]|uniref:Mannitol dehydrogenase n=1 Tax=Rhodobium orientis TaxID=34017 RepID=A0A327JR44_9HYPH|nr:mannitol dehydrogenase family protein [Rhodobium orientis]MBB4303222.1 fructuronate reductase [Rhodobium orientis]MBK5951677.1 hypothetical protein [Rhodobium orientis]RAI25848.1 hypothetical protein CH339_16565 [Rhodobium orientis]